MTIPAELDNLLRAYRDADFYTLKVAKLVLVEYIQKDYQRGVKDGEQWAMRASAALQFKDPSAFKQECDDADELIRLLGLNPDQCRTDGGSINLMRVRTLLAELLPCPACGGEAIDKQDRLAGIIVRKRGLTDPKHLAPPAGVALRSDEPAAWRWRWKTGSTGWALCTDKPDEIPNLIVQPLYLAAARTGPEGCCSRCGFVLPDGGACPCTENRPYD